ncbi:MAG: hypothetical protein IT381_26845 [Deltaproteobacteria bacterium]|nr:hypothetical protein [Deltaproteobacteria bacterium]
MRRSVVLSFLLVACTKPSETKPVDPEVVAPDLVQKGAAAVVVANPTAPAGEDGTTLAWSSAAEMDAVTVVVDRDSAVLELPAVSGAKDYRAYRLAAGVSLDGTRVVGGDVHCAGYRQRNAEAPASHELMRRLEVTGLGADAIVVVEAVDRACPFTGVLGVRHKDLTVTSDEVPPADRVPFSIFTEAEIRAAYGSLIRNGHGPGALAAPADPMLAAPVVLARTALKITPVASPASATFFDDFASDDQPVFVSNSSHSRTQQGKIFQNQKWSFYTYGADDSQTFIERGKLHTVLADWQQNIFSTNIAYPRQAAQLPAASGKYLQVSFDVHSNSTQRRYWWFVLCGAAAAGETMDANGLLKGLIVQTAFFYQPDGRNPSVAGWNCLQVFPRDGWPFDLGPTDTRPESDVRVMVNTAGAGDRDNVVNVSPAQYDNPNVAPPGWYRQQDASGKLTAPMLDDLTVLAPRTKIALFIRRDRVVMFVNGEQRLCNDFPANALTMAEAAVGFGQVLYHSTAERVEFSRDYWMRTGQRYYLQNTPYVDERTWDNLGYSENVAAPQGFDEAKCFRK